MNFFYITYDLSRSTKTILGGLLLNKKSDPFPTTLFGLRVSVSKVLSGKGRGLIRSGEHVGSAVSRRLGRGVGRRANNYRCADFVVDLRLAAKTHP